MKRSSYASHLVPLDALEDGSIIKRIRGHWLTKRPDPNAFFVAGFSVLALVLATYLYWDNIFSAASWITASHQNVFVDHQYWRPWTALFAHADLQHLLSNAFLFSIFAYLLYGHFGMWVFPIWSFVFGGITNFIVLKTLPPETHLLGASGVVYWMGAVWLTLYFCLESRDKIWRRAVKGLGVALILFIPQTIQANVSYLCHGVGFGLGVMWALFYFGFNRDRFRQAEIVEFVTEEFDPLTWTEKL